MDPFDGPVPDEGPGYRHPECQHADCGQPGRRGRPRAGWLAVHWPPAVDRWYCSGRCACYGIGLSELREPGLAVG